MDLRLSDAERALQADLRNWLAATLPTLPAPPAPDDWPARAAYDRAWQRRLLDAGYAGLDWPREYGGGGASPVEQLVFLEELARAGAPAVGVNFVGLLHAGPTLMAEGTSEQKSAHLAPILGADEIWCQGFSEPGAGSDLAALRTRAERDGEEYVVSGQKIWSSFAQVADHAELLVRTDPGAARHRGISWLILDMSSPGITVRPIRTAMGTSEFSEVFLDEVRVPVANRVGAENDGWRVAMVTFAFERGTAFVTELVNAMRLVRELAAVARRVTRGSGTAWEDAGLRRELGRMAAELDALWALTKRNVTQASRAGVPGPGGSVLKLRLCEAAQELSDLALRVLGRAGLAMEDVGELPSGRFVEERLRSLGFTIGGGTSQIQRNIVAERLLGLPKEPPAPAPGR
jgi:alkylation response protein AidB-like acyl-CoA dehydrogenase